MLVALLVRVGHLGYGLPDVYHPDEARIVARAVRVHTGALNPHFFNWPSLSVYLLATVYGLMALPDPAGAARAFARDPALFYLVGRFVTVAFGAATVVALYALAAPLYGRIVGLLAGLFLAVDLLHVHDSRFVTTDVPMTALVAFAVGAALRYERTGSRRVAGAAGFVAGLAASMKYPGALAFVPLTIAGLRRLRLDAPPGGRRALRDLGLGAALALGGFLLGTPFAVLSPVEFLRGVLGEVGEVHSAQFGNEAELPAPLFHLLHALPTAMGPPVALLAVAGLGLVLARGGPREATWLSFPIVYFLLIATWSARFERYAVPLLPFAALLAALAVAVLAEEAHRRLPLRRVSLGVTLVAVTGLCLIPAVARLVTFQLVLARPDTREVAAAWIERQIPLGARIAVEPYGPSLPVGRSALTETPGTALLDLARSPGEGAGAVAPPPAGAGDAGYRLVRLNTYDLGRLEGEGIDYVVLSGFVFRRHLQACDRYPEPCRFYQLLDRHATLLLTVGSGADDGRFTVGDIYAPLTRLRERARPGPEIRIYRLLRAREVAS